MGITDKNKSTIERLKDLQQLYEAGILNKEEMEAEKAEILGKNKSNETSVSAPQPPITSSVPPTPAINAAAKEEPDVDYNAYINEEEPFWHSTKGTATIIAIVAIALAVVIFCIKQCSSGGRPGIYGTDSLSVDTSYTDTTDYAIEDKPVNDFKHIKKQWDVWMLIFNGLWLWKGSMISSSYNVA